MDRRAFISMVGGTILAKPLTAEAQQAGKVYRIVISLKAQVRALRASVLSRDSGRGCANSGGSRVKTS